MAVDINSQDAKLLRKLIPLATLPRIHFEAVCAESTIENASKGFVLFNKGDENQKLFYLLYGEVVLEADGLRLETISANKESAKFAIAHQVPRKIDAVANSNIRYLRLDPDTLKNPPALHSEEKSEYMVTEETDDTNEGSEDWMTQLLRKPVFQHLPGSNLQKILMGLREVEFKEGEYIVKQDEPGDYYYVVIEGECSLMRKPSANAKEIKLGQLSKLNTFGEDALLSGLTRNLSVKAKTDVKLLRLDKQKFVTLIQEPSLKYIDHNALQREMDQGAILLDVRSPDAFQVNSLKDSINAPYFSLRMYIKNINRKRKVIVVCEDGKISAAAAFLLLGYKLNVVILEGGMKKVQPGNNNTSATFEVQDAVEIIVNENFPERIDNAVKTEKAVNKEIKEIKEINENEKNDSYSENSSSQEDNLEITLNLLKTENESLKETIQDLKQQCAALAQEKEQLDEQLQESKRSSEELKNILKKIAS